MEYVHVVSIYFNVERGQTKTAVSCPVRKHTVGILCPCIHIFVRDIARGDDTHVRWRRARGWGGWVGLVTSHDSWLVVCASTVHARARPRDASSTTTSDERRATNDERRRTSDDGINSRAGRRTGGRTMTDDRVETTDDASRFIPFIHSSRDDSFIHLFIHSFATRARGVCPSMHRCERARLARRIFSRRVRASIGRTRRRARREVVESTPRVFSFIHSFIHSNE